MGLNRLRGHLGSREPECSPSDVLRTLPNPYRAALLSIYEGEPQLAEDGERHRLDGCTKISPVEGMWIYELCRQAKPHATLEIGLAYGFGTIYFLAALAENGDSRHPAIDPPRLGGFHIERRIVLHGRIHHL